MASAAEQFAQNFSFSSLGRSSELKNRLLFTLGALIVYRLGTYIPYRALTRLCSVKFLPNNSKAFWACLTCYRAVRWDG